MKGEKNLKCSECEGKEFITRPDSYSVYKIIGEKLRFVSTEPTQDEGKLYCRDCGAEFYAEGVRFF